MSQDRAIEIIRAGFTRAKESAGTSANNHGTVAALAAVEQVLLDLIALGAQAPDTVAADDLPDPAGAVAEAPVQEPVPAPELPSSEETAP